MKNNFNAGYFNYANLFNLSVSLDFFLEAMFLWIIPLDAAISMDLIAEPNRTLASSRFPAVTAVSYFLMAVLSADLTILFLSVFVAVILILFFDDLMFATFSPPPIILSTISFFNII